MYPPAPYYLWRMLGSRQQVQSDNNTSKVNADDNAIAIEDDHDDNNVLCPHR